MADPSAYRGTPRWVKIFGIIAIVLVMLFIILHVAGVGYVRSYPATGRSA